MEQCAIEDNCLLALRSGYPTIADCLGFYQARIAVLNIQRFPAGFVKLNFASRRRCEKGLGWARGSKIASVSVLPTLEGYEVWRGSHTAPQICGYGAVPYILLAFNTSSLVSSHILG